MEITGHRAACRIAEVRGQVSGDQLKDAVDATDGVEELLDRIALLASDIAGHSHAVDDLLSEMNGSMISVDRLEKLT